MNADIAGQVGRIQAIAAKLAGLRDEPRNTVGRSTTFGGPCWRRARRCSADSASLSSTTRREPSKPGNDKIMWETERRC